MDTASTSESLQGRRGLGLFLIQADHLDKAVISADYIRKFAKGEKISLDTPGYDLPDNLKDITFDKEILLVAHHNAYVNTGLNNALDREWGLGGTAIGWIGVDNNTTAVTASTTFLHGAGAGSAATTIIKALSPAATRSSQTTTGGATFANADFTSGIFVINKIGLLFTSTDAGTGLVDVIGGTAGSSPYNRTFSMDLTAVGTFTAVLQIAVTATAV